MQDRNLRMVKRQTAMTVGLCEACGKQFKSHIHPPSQAEWEIAVLFHRHKCKKLPGRTELMAGVVAPPAS
jgi:hypothetical protein